MKNLFARTVSGLEISKRENSISQKALTLATIAMLISFMSWSSLSPLANSIASQFGLNITLQKILVALPVLFGSLLRIPLGKLSDNFGGKKIYLSTLGISLIPLALAYFVLKFHLSINLLFLVALGLGISGASFAISLSYASAWFPESRQGRTLGIVGIGTVGNAISSGLLPFIQKIFHSLTSVYSFLFFITLIFIGIFKFIGDEVPINFRKKEDSPKLDKRFSLFSLSFACMVASGSFVAFGALLPTFLGIHSIFGLSSLTAGLWGAVFSVLTIVTRPLGGYFADISNARIYLVFSLFGIMICQFLISFFIQSLFLFLFVFMTYAVFIGLCNGCIFKITAEYFPRNIGFASGIVGAVGSFGGFLFPFIFVFVPSSSVAFIVLGFLTLFSVFSSIFSLKIF
ncbi:MFS transporter [Lactococcus protaetiae]|uniref:MFS transporter n=1 Tax=Lactococcus protaetiae TaxID=2592653 RepID=A0A514Z8R9_9LACT|nr:MFS transporter [Lactococcus protaetiae]QDK70976.1 MFS transporter [Lactococcus protaetiae]